MLAYNTREREGIGNREASQPSGASPPFARCFHAFCALLSCRHVQLWVRRQFIILQWVPDYLHIITLT